MGIRPGIEAATAQLFPHPEGAAFFSPAVLASFTAVSRQADPSRVLAYMNGSPKLDDILLL
jgi:hypothetical protein